MKGKVWLISFFACLAGISAVVSSASAQGIGDRNRASDGGDGRFSIMGRVYLPDGKPATNAKISISSADALGSSSTTNMDGEFQVGGLRAGNYNISVRLEGYPTENEPLTIDRDAAPGRTFNVVIHMRGDNQRKGDNFSNALLKDVPKDAAAKYEKGIEQEAKGDHKAAVSSFDSAIAAYPNFAAAYYEKGSTLLRTNDPDKAVEAFVKAISIKPDYVEAKYGYGLAQFEKKNYEVAAAAFNDVLQQRKDMAEAHLNLGISMFYLKNSDAAESELKTAVSSKGGEKLALAHLYLGQIYIQRKRNAEAVTELEKYLELLPKAPNADRIRTAIADLKKQS